MNKTYEEYKPIKFGQVKTTLKNGKVKITPNIKRITVTDYKNIVIIDGKLFKEVKNKGEKNFENHSVKK